MKKEIPLVSIIVITYNSSYVLETLESIKNQSYKNIELIISDDCSTDSSVSLCQRWLEKNESHFIHALLVTNPCNQGIPANCNRGIRAAQGEWIKLIAGDDLLMPNCISDYINTISPEIDILVGRIQCFTTDQKGNKIEKDLFPMKQNLSFFQLSPLKQHKIIELQYTLQ